MEKYILDTNYFVNLEIKSGFGNSPKEVVESFCYLAAHLKKEKKAEFYITPNIIKEMETFFEDKSVIEGLKVVCVIKSPDFSKIDFPSTVFYQLIDEIRDRSYRGLKVAEEVVEKTAESFLGQVHLEKIAFQKKSGELIKNLRDRYRQATRVNFLDSVVDLEIITLARELDGTLVSADEGVLRWGRIFGVREVDPHLFKAELESL